LHDRAFLIRIDGLLVQERLESVARALQVLDPAIDLLELVDGGGGYRADVDNSERSPADSAVKSVSSFRVKPSS
jgi:hypothetical protein